MNKEETYESVKEYYGKVLEGTSDLKTNACCCSKIPTALKKIIKKIPMEIVSKFYGCGNPIPLGIEGLHVLDLGSGSGRDCYIASALVGEKGSVTGIDMTDEQLDVARKHAKDYTTKTLGYKTSNLSFKKGYIEYLEKAGVKKDSMDLVISNCVVNLSPNKKRVLESVYSVLKEGGEFHFSDVYCDRRLPEKVRKHKVLYGECLSGALYVQDFLRLCREVGFTDPRELSRSVITVKNEELQDVLGEAKFYSITYRLFKLKNLETLCEDYGQYAVYKGTLGGSKHSYKLDDHHYLVKNKPFLVCGNTASMLGETWLKNHFKVVGDRSTHYGLFDCSNGDSKGSSSNLKSGCC